MWSQFRLDQDAYDITYSAQILTPLSSTKHTSTFAACALAGITNMLASASVIAELRTFLSMLIGKSSQVEILNSDLPRLKK